MTSRRGVLVRFTVWMGVLCMLAQISSIMHMAFVPHVRCAEHGEWVHAEDRDPHSLLAAHIVLVDDASAPSVGHASDTEDHDDDHCVVVTQSRSPVVTAASGGPLAAADHVCAADDAAVEVRVTAPDRYRIAPKTSPPA